MKAQTTHPADAARNGVICKPPGPSPALGRLLPWSIAVQVLTLTFAGAQAASNFDTKKISPNQPPAAQQAKPSKAQAAPADAEKEPAATNIVPSRYVSAEELDGYVQTLSSVFSMSGRETDPFGQYQDPDAKPVIKTPVAKNSRHTAAPKAIPFSEIIAKLKVTTIIAGEHRFLVGARSFKQGGSLPIIHRGKPINAEIISVSSQRIDFRNTETGEPASLEINVLPAGMTQGTHGITAPGMVPDGQNAPLNLDSDIP